MQVIEYVCKKCDMARLCVTDPDLEENNGLCPRCRLGGSRNKGARHGMWRGGRMKHSGGYKYIHIDTLSADEQILFRGMVDKGNYILEHRIIAARNLGRPLTKEEIAHHKNGIKDDNCPANIAVFSCAGVHISYHHAQGSYK